MRTVVQEFSAATQTTLSNGVRRGLFLLLTGLIAWLLFLVPVRVIPGNDVAFWASLFGPTDYLLLLVVAALEGLLQLMGLHLWSQSRPRQHTRPRLANESLGVLSGLPVFLFGTKICPMCIVGFLGFLGPSAVFFAVDHRHWFFSLWSAILLLSLFSVSRKITRSCEQCVG